MIFRIFDGGALGFGLTFVIAAEPSSLKLRSLTPRSAPMPYEVNADLPPSVRSHLPEHAQDIFREAFNHAHAAHAHDPRQEEAAFRIAWAAVKREYMKVGDQWERQR
jgi:cation transport regulator